MGRTSDAAFKFVLEKNVEVSSSSSNYNIPRWHLNYWCFDPGLAMRSLKSNGASSIILTSGTLSPLDSLAKELAL